MGNNLYRIVFKGKLSEGHTIEEVKETLRKKFKLNESRIQKILSGKTIILKSGIDRSNADKYIRVFADSGLICTQEMLPLDNETPHNKNIKTGDTHSNNLSDKNGNGNEEENQSVMNVRSILGFNCDKLKTVNPAISYSETHNASEKKLKPDQNQESITSKQFENPPEEINRNSFQERTVIEKTPEPIPVPLKDNHSSPDERYRIIFSGIVTSGKNINEVKKALQNIYGIGLNDVDILFSNKQLVLKDNVKKARAIQYIELLQNAGAESKMEKIDDKGKGEFSGSFESVELKNGVIANEKAKMELKGVEEKIEDVKKYRNHWLSAVNDHKAMTRNVMNWSAFKNFRVEKIKLHNSHVRIKEAVDKYNDTAQDLTINIRISLAVPKGILMGSISRIMPDFIKESEKKDFYSSLNEKDDLKKINIKDSHIKDIFRTIMKINQIDKKIDDIRERAFNDFSEEITG